MTRTAGQTYRITQQPNQSLPDTDAFVDLLNNRGYHTPPQLDGFFSEGEVIVTRAPGRLDLMGGFADYSGAMVLEMPIAAAAHAAIQLSENREIQARSLPSNAHGQHRVFKISLDSFTGGRTTIQYDAACDLFSRDPLNGWAAYVLGAFIVLMREKNAVFKQGARILIQSVVPEAKGVSSSAALEVATMQAVLTAYGIEIEPREVPFLCQKVENLVAGAPCGVMDQMTAVCGEAGKLLALLCQPGEIVGTIEVPEDLKIWGLDSGIRHSIAGSDYTTVRTAAFMGYRIIAELAGLDCYKTNSESLVRVVDDRWNGYLANITPDEFATKFAPYLPERMSGGDFLHQYEGTTDPITKVVRDQVYPVLHATRHPIYEHSRVTRFVNLLQTTKDEKGAQALGQLMYQAHQSYTDCGVGSEQTDALVDLVRLAGPARGLYGAKITGGGSGGTVALLGNNDADAAVEDIAASYQKQTGQVATIISGSSPGAAAFGYMKLQIN